MSEEKYVLLHRDGQYFKEQNLYLGVAILTDDINLAAHMSLEDAEKKYGCMNEKRDWKIFLETETPCQKHTTGGGPCCSDVGSLERADREIIAMVDGLRAALDAALDRIDRLERTVEELTSLES